MNKSLMKTNFMYMFMISILMILNSESYFYIWATIELNVIMFVPLIKNFNSMNSLNMMKYFIIQSISSSLFLFFLINSYNFTLNNSISEYMIFISMWLKMGLFPFSQWFFQITENFDWKMWMLINTTQKISPLWILSHNLYDKQIFNALILINATYSSMEIWNQVSLRWLMNSSSLNHMSWMMISQNFNQEIWKVYFMVYFLMSMCLYMIFKNNNLNSFMSMANLNTIKFLNLTFTLMNFMGLPPMAGFLPKLMILKLNNNLFLMILMILNSLILITIYVSILKMMVLKKITNKIKNEELLMLYTNMVLLLSMMYVYLYL